MALWGKKKEEPVAVAPAPAPAVAPVPAGERSAAPVTQATAPVSNFSEADKKQRAQVSAHLLQKFGEIVSVLMRQPQFRNLPLAQVEVLVLPPLLSGQFLVAEATSATDGFVTPVAAALWARVSMAVDARLSTDLDKLQLAPNEWTSGDIPWLIVLAGDARVLAPMLKALQEGRLGGKPIKMRMQQDGKTIVGTFAAGAMTL